ncbi:bilirubin oxidase [Alicycliphilus denitrificans]|uniref:multicopper oxidase family protein n=1 Tax=Comamonadaceae TaxID=80864 RepID=UPI0015579251|nr:MULTISPECIES: multicopper oxidase domain-containing protein [Comamonadaceae]MBN9575679.1 multicopper oxidase domain-containing protein [Alicycliphilus denitrificans]QJY33276.1 multicopper oxidase domain-containing protein [Diaphorobacter sp. JS3050]BCN39582.1 bilirubin oxidase [Alicycliphilus denitrificans]
MNQQRRRILMHSATAVAVAALGLPEVSARAGGEEPAAANIDVHIELHAMQDSVAIRPGAQTQVWRYQGKLLRGDANTLDASAGTYLGPIIRVHRGQRVRIDLINELPESTIIHWHGLHVPEPMDGHPRYAIAPGARYVYEFTVVNRAGSYWFHPHPHGRTGKQVYFGLAGLFLVSDDEEAALELPTGSYDLPLVLQDRTFDDDNQFVYLSQSPAGAAAESSQDHGMMGGGGMGGMTDRGMMGGMGQMMARMMGVFGDQILVNGRPDASMAVERDAYRLRLFNASNARIYKLAWHDGSPLTVIGTDGGLLAAPLQRDYVMLAPAERVDLWVDFGRWLAGTELTLQSLAFEGGMAMNGMMGGMMDESALPDGAPFPVLKLQIQHGRYDKPTLPPQRLSQLPRPEPRVAVNFNHPKVFNLTMGMMTWGINGHSFDMLGVSPLETVKLGTHEVWEFRNDGQTGMMGMAMAHAMHVHGLQFRVIGRSVAAAFSRQQGTVKAGLLDEGWKDTVLVMPGERVRILLGFKDYPGLFLYHCHMLEHEDSGLMRNYLVQA